jgi:hypothetical protein
LINQYDLNYIDLYDEDGNKINIPKGTISEWAYSGMNNIDFILYEAYREDVNFSSEVNPEIEYERTNEMEVLKVNIIDIQEMKKAIKNINNLPFEKIELVNGSGEIIELSKNDDFLWMTNFDFIASEFC